MMRSNKTSKIDDECFDKMYQKFKDMASQKIQWTKKGQVDKVFYEPVDKDLLDVIKIYLKPKFQDIYSTQQVI
jgi:hypothetical protein